MCVWRTGSQSVKWEILSKRDKKWKSGLNLKMSTTAASLRIGGRIFNVCAFCRLADFTQLFALSSAVSLALSLLVTRPWRALARRCLLTWHTHPGLSQLWGIQIKKKKRHIHNLITFTCSSEFSYRVPRSLEKMSISMQCHHSG